MRRLWLAGLFLYIGALSAQEVCHRPPPERVSAEQMTKVLCEAADNGAFLPSTDSMWEECKLGLGGATDLVKQSLVDGVEGVKHLAAAAARKVLSVWNSSDDAAVAAEQAARANTESSKSWLTTVSEYADASKIMVQTFIHNLNLMTGTMGCLPLKVSIHHICQFISHVALDLLALQTVATAADKTVAAGRVVNEFIRKSNMVEELRGASMATRLKAAGEALETQAQYKMVERFGESGNLRSRVDPISGREKLYFEEMAVVDGKKLSSLHEIPRDAKTLAVDANFEWGKHFAKLTAENTKGGHLAFIDVNNLGMVNYFKGGTQAGDEYLSAVSQSIRKQLRAEDRFFKNGGDELVLVLKSDNAQDVKKVIQRIHNGIEKDQALQKLFKQERTAIADGIRKSKTNKTKPSPEQIAALQASAKIRPSLSIGSTKITGIWSDDLARAEKQAGVVKATYKSDIGLEASKYRLKGSIGTAPQPRFIAKPKVLDPAN